MTGHDYLLKWLKETYPLMDSADYGELNYYDMQKFAVWIVNLSAIPPVIKSVCIKCGNVCNKENSYICADCSEKI